MKRNAFRSVASAALSMVIGLAIVGSLAGLLAGCGPNDPAKERSAKAVSGLRDTREELAAARTQVDKTQAALDRLQTAPADRRLEFDAYKEQVKAIESQAKSIAERTADMQSRGAEYQQKWAADAAQLSDPSLKANVQSRAAKVRGRYVIIAAKGQAARAAYQPYIRDLTDVQTFLSGDLSPAAVQSAGPVIQKARADGQLLKQKLDDLSGELDSVAAELSSGAPPP